ncbi:hypothetical protein DPMN_094323 [Dreissena polymorpha]|uniref:Uncharacterized protein n=1 Tax=Dreissena polymorpha TaxID=45954 RepID=A0A9D4R1R1_DREPO|nr:hypothetical protein DPMN_094323 [Dreissena polymorpha]
MSEALEESGAGKNTVMERRGSYLWRERLAMMLLNITGQNVECFHFGSQSEGTTIPGLQSDIDFLMSHHDVNIMFYTIEKTHPSLWFEHNIMFLLWLCLHVFRK